MPDAETRSTEPLDLAGRTVTGYAAVFESPTVIAGEFVEIIQRGAFTDTLRSADVRALLDHNRGRVLGRTSAGTLRLREDLRGLAVEIDLDPSNPDAAGALSSIRRRDLDGMSFGFKVLAEDWDDRPKRPVRRIQKVQLLEVSIVAWPAYPETSIALRGLETTRRQHNFNAAAHRLRMKTELDLRLRGIAR